MIEIDRSRIIAWQTCPRKRFLEYHVNGTGLQRKAKGLPLIFGSAFHAGAEELLAGDVETACYRAMKFLRDTFSERGVGLDGEDNQTDAALQYAAEEQMALAEGLIRAWGAARLPHFLETFDVLEVEQEGRASLSPGSASVGADGLVLMFRPDALLRDRTSGDLYVASWKTCSTYGKRNMAQAKVDMQSMSEVWGIQAQKWDEGEVQYAGSIEGVLYLWIVKGKRQLDKWDSLYKQNTPLIYGWKKLANGDDLADWSHSYSWDKEDGSGEGRLGKGWKKVPIWRDYEGGVKQWIDDLHNQRVFPRHVNALDSIFPESLPVERRADEVESWKRQVVAQEIEIPGLLKEVEMAAEIGPEAQREVLDECFPQYTHSCSAYSGCSYQDICWNGVPAEPGELYTIRSANHPEGKGDEE